MPRLVSATTPRIIDAAQRLSRGEVIAFPTETVYGLGADTFNAIALERIYELKGRPAANPLIAHVLNASAVKQVASTWDDRCAALAAKFWPGPLTLVLPKHRSVPDRATAGLPTIAVRSPRHPVARRLLMECKFPVSAPSANRSGAVSATRAEHVAADFADVPDLLILDAGPTQLGIESTVLDMTGAVPRILRPGSVTLEQLREVLGDVAAPLISAQTSSPGTSQSHYAPRTAAELIDPEQLESRLRQSRRNERWAVLCHDPSRVSHPHRAIALPLQAEAYATQLYGALRQADALECDRIIIEMPTSTSGLWRSIIDRLHRAVAPPVDLRSQ